ncbi:LPS export ABC transporter periplasmic protein LptC [Lascolabacillus massiliensis]|uniref:LPS export ABC transporter periplasmic protein LptC n=1 Tax=Lascolabacillus massiliensis TaxID=1627894 RepID=UPI0012B87451|nr:LPS export ABC transporter periplasmic protein LptC [Lascolabacillus massiliensis]
MLKLQHNISKFRRITTTLWLVVMLLYFVSCKNGNDNLVDFKYDPEVIPTMITDSAYQLLSDSGVTRYKISYDVWMVFDKAKEPYQFFPNGLYLERFTPDFTTEATVEADTAWYFDDKKLWRLRSNVHVQNMQGEEFNSEELFWDMENGKVYSNTYIEIKRKDSQLKGYGFESNEQMTDYRIFRPHDGKLPFVDKPSVPTDSLEIEKTDSTANINKIGDQEAIILME